MDGRGDSACGGEVVEVQGQVLKYMSETVLKVLGLTSDVRGEVSKRGSLAHPSCRGAARRRKGEINDS